jgi:hypothetical protein
VINKALNLPFEEIPETYSTSEHLFHEQGIAPGTKGRLVPAAPEQRKPREDRDERPRNGSRERSRTRSGQGTVAATPAVSERRSDGDAAPKRSRNRRRTRSGQPAAAASE